MRKIEIVIDEKDNRENCYECAHVTIADEKGAKKSGLVTMDSLLAALTNSIAWKRVNIPVGRVPFGYYEATVGKYGDGFCAEAVTVLPAGRQMVQYEETQYDICMPSLVFRFKVEENRIRQTEVYVIKEEKPVENTRLYRYPFGNVREDGYVCWGGNVLPEVRELKALEEAMMLFIQSPGNSDYYEGKKYCGHEGLTLRQLYELLKDREDYPEEYLVPAKKRDRKLLLKDLLLKDLLSWKNE